MSRRVVYTVEADETLEGAAGTMDQQESGSLAMPPKHDVTGLVGMCRAL